METTIPSQTTRASWIRLASSHWSLVFGILLLAAFLRLYRISEYMTFLGDEGRDVLIVKHLLEGDLIGLGPTASVGGFFLGPIYYYFMAPFLWLFGFSPVGPAVMVALFGIATVFLIYLVGKEFFNREAGIFAAALYAVSPLVIAYSRSSWNPNLMPFFSLFTIFLLFKAVEKSSWKLFVSAGILLGIAMQLHYLATFLAVIIVVYILFIRLRTLLKRYAQIFLGFLLGFSPFLAFETTHGFPNIKTIIKFTLGATGETGFVGEKFISIVGDIFFRLFARLVTRFPPPEQVAISENSLLQSWQILTVALALFSVFLLFKRINRAKLLLIIWLTLGIGLFGFYRKPIYDYYFGFIFPLPFLLVGNFLSNLYTWEKLKNLGQILTVIIFVGLIWFNLDGLPFRYPPNRQLDQVKKISEFVLEKAEGQPFNFALITGGNSDHAYRYFFELAGSTPITIKDFETDFQRETVTSQLLIICEDPSCKPLGHPLWEVAGFGRAEIIGEWDVSVVKVYKLIHYKEKL